jgi:Tol biopolymer transport system component
MPRLIIILILVIIFQISSSQGQDPFAYNHPELNWSTFETEHYYVHFHQGTRRTAELVGKIAEDIYEPVTNLYDYQPSGKIHFIIKDTDDYSNGGAYFFDNKVEIWSQNLDYIMRGTKNWLRDVVTHEFTHMIQIQKSIKTSKTVPYGFFQYFDYEPERRKDVVRGFPNTIVSYPISSIAIPVWFAEGVAQQQNNNARYDYRDPNREMIIRDRIINHKMLSYAEMGVFGKNSQGNESAYNLGFAFVKYLCERFGENVLEKISEESSKLSVLTFDKALENATGISADELYTDWKSGLEQVYKEKLSRISQNEVKGTAVEEEGFANLHPVWSPDGKKIAYISNKGNDSFSQNRIVIYDVEKQSKVNHVPSISSSISWSPDGKYIVYTTHMNDSFTGSRFQDLFIYDVAEKRSHRISKFLRAKNPDWSNDGKKIVFVTENDGLNQLYLLEIDDLYSGLWEDYLIDIATGNLVTSESKNVETRKTKIRGGALRQLGSIPAERKIYHPRWSPDDRQLVMDTSTDYGRDIALFKLSDQSFEIIISGKAEQRYPVFHPNKNILYYTSGKTGIYNIYKRDMESGETTLITNVSGGAVMADVNNNDELVYSLYDNLGYHIYTLPNHPVLDAEMAVYEEDYLASVPDKNFNDSVIPDWEVEPYRQQFTGVHILPRLLIDYGTIKPGAYLFASDVLDKMTFIAGAAINTNFDYDLYGIFEYRNFFPTLFIEGYNLSQNITDTLGIRTGRDLEVIDQDINFDLTEVQMGMRFYFPELIQWRIAYRISLYHAKLQWFDPFANDILNFRYRYLDGRAIEIRLQADHIKYDKHRYINPSGGRFVQFKYSHESNDFLVDFDTGKNIGLEVYRNYSFNKFELDWEEYYSVPFFTNHAFSFRLRAGYIDEPVDDFFFLWGGGLVGMKGYSYFSMGGTNKLITTFTYRMPLIDHINWQLFNIYFDKLYLGVFYDYGNAWVGNGIYPDDFKQDVGIQLRLDAFSNYLFPTRVFWEAAYPINDVNNFNVTYGNEWRYYFGILFDFDIRERQSPHIAYPRRPYR